MHPEGKKKDVEGKKKRKGVDYVFRMQSTGSPKHIRKARISGKDGERSIPKGKGGKGQRSTFLRFRRNRKKLGRGGHFHNYGGRRKKPKGEKVGNPL